jgi:hypothetical protein
VDVLGGIFEGQHFILVFMQGCFSHLCGLPYQLPDIINATLVNQRFKAYVGFTFVVCPFLLYYPEVALILKFPVRYVSAVQYFLFPQKLKKRVAPIAGQVQYPGDIPHLQGILAVRNLIKKSRLGLHFLVFFLKVIYDFLLELHRLPYQQGFFKVGFGHGGDFRIFAEVHFYRCNPGLIHDVIRFTAVRTLDFPKPNIFGLGFNVLYAVQDSIRRNPQRFRHFPDGHAPVSLSCWFVHRSSKKNGFLAAPSVKGLAKKPLFLPL